MRGGVAEESNDESLEEDYEKNSVWVRFAKKALVEGYKKENNSWSGIKDLCINLQLYLLCSEDEVMYARDNFDKTDEESTSHKNVLAELDKSLYNLEEFSYDKCELMYKIYIWQ